MKRLLVSLLVVNALSYAMEDDKITEGKALIHLTYKRLMLRRKFFLDTLDMLQEYVDQDTSEEYKKKIKKQIKEIKDSFTEVFSYRSPDFCDLCQKLDITEHEESRPNRTDLLSSRFIDIYHVQIGEALIQDMYGGRTGVIDVLLDLKEQTRFSDGLTDKSGIHQTITNLHEQICAAVDRKIYELDESLEYVI